MFATGCRASGGKEAAEVTEVAEVSLEAGKEKSDL